MGRAPDKAPGGLERVGRNLGANLLTLAVVLMALSMVVYPEPAFAASVHGLKIFWEIVFPSLLPFFVLSELMLGMGVVHFIGVLFEPLMRPLFSVPGEGAFALSMGLAAGYPMDAVITGKFRRAGMCTRVEGERLLAFTNTADPLFMFGAVAVGMFGRSELGVTLAAAHYLAALGVGLLFKFHATGDPPSANGRKDGPGNILVRAIDAMYRARGEDGRAFGQLMGDAVNDSVKTLLMIGGFIMSFSVLIKMLTVTGLAAAIETPIAAAFSAIGVDGRLVDAALQGLFEIDLGAAAAAAADAPMAQKVMMASAIIAWSGLSVHGQVASVVTGTDIRMGPYGVARVIHAVLASLFTLALYEPAQVTLRAVEPLLQPAEAVLSRSIAALPPFWQHLELATWRALAVPAALFGLSLLCLIPRTLRVVWVRLSR